MANPSPRDALVLTGPTASGKTELSLAVAERLGAEVISMDSRQVYRGMDVGTAKATRAERRCVPHHGLDVVEPDERYSAGRFAEDARRWIGEIRARGRVPLLVGGTGFFLRALTHPLFREPEMSEERRERLEHWMDEQPLDRLRGWVRALDPERARTLGRGGGGGRQRFQRTLEVTLLSGRPLSWWHEHAPPEHPPLDALIVVLTRPRDELYERINGRVHDMIEDGLVEEVEGLLERGYGPDDPGMSATGYIELVPYLRGERTLDEAVDLIQRATRRYARRQLTWFRNQLPEDAVRVDATRPEEELVEEVVGMWEGG